MIALDSYKKVLSFLTAAMTFACLSTGCGSKNSSSDSTSEDVPSASELGTDTDADAEQLTEKTVSMDSLFSDRDLAQDYGEITAEIKLNGDSAETDGPGVSADGSVITVTGEGIYHVTGTLNDGQIIVDADNAKVQLVLDNASLTCTTSAPIYIVNADKTFITLAAGSKNSVTDGSSYTFADETVTEPDAAIFSEDSLTVNGTGSLEVNGNYNDGIRSKDDIVITGGTISVNAVADGIKGKDYVAAAGGDVTVVSGQDGIKSTNKTDTSLGFVCIEGGSFDITSGEDGIQAETMFTASDGEFNIVSAGGSENSSKTHTDGFGGMGGGMGGQGGFGGGRPDMQGGDFDTGQFGDFDPSQGGGFGHGQFGDFDPSQGGGFAPGQQDGAAPEDTTQAQQTAFTPLADTSAEDSGDTSDTVSTKGIKAGTELDISGGTFTINSADDALHSNGSLTVSGGTLTLEAGDDGIHAETSITISDGKTSITKSYEGIEAAVINIEGGTVEVTSSDDGFNASDGTSQGAMGSYSSGAALNISGGMVYVNASGDGLDSNGDMSISGGTIIVNGPTNSGNGALDSNSEIVVTGGTIIAAGSSGMAEAPGNSSTQYSVSASLGSTFEGGTLVTLTDSQGTELFSFAPEKSFDHIVISSPDLKSGETYTVYTGGSTDASEKYYGLYENGGYKNDGTEAGSVTAENVTSYIGSQGMMGGGMGGGMNGGRPGGFGGQDGSFEPPTDENGQFTMPEGIEPTTDENGQFVMPEGGGRGRRNRQQSDTGSGDDTAA
ncbi:MAG: carbohydrate-binding domain-containing protein [Ruminococcus sp.]|nr:carbohydrate-binding domain-containing protein [Ruminococcus sp.]